MTSQRFSQINVAILGVGMMGQEHISYMEKYSQINIKFLCDPCVKMIQRSLSLISSDMKPEIFYDEKELIKRVKDIDLLVISTPNFMHTPQLLRWAMHPICILVEKPVAISEKQIMALDAAKHDFSANIWVAMEYRYIPAIQKLYQLLPSIGSIKNITIRENRFPFLSKVSEWNKDPQKTGDTLVEKCCHFFDLFRLISGKEMKNCAALILRGLLDHEYGYDKRKDNPTRIIDSAYVLLDLSVPSNESKQNNETIGCLELCMYADGSRHQEEIVVTGTKGRLEAYLPENKVFHFERAKESQWKDRSQPPPRKSIKEEVIDCSDLSIVYSFAKDIPQHSGHHYYSTAVEWKYLIETIENWKKGQKFIPQVTLEDGIAAVKMGITAQTNVWNKTKEEVDTSPNPLIAFSTKSSDQLLNLAIDIAANVSLKPKLSPNFHVDNELIDSHNFNEEEKGP